MRVEPFSTSAYARRAILAARQLLNVHQDPTSVSMRLLICRGTGVKAFSTSAHIQESSQSQKLEPPLHKPEPQSQMPEPQSQMLEPQSQVLEPKSNVIQHPPDRKHRWMVRGRVATGLNFTQREEQNLLDELRRMDGRDLLNGEQFSDEQPAPDQLGPLGRAHFSDLSKETIRKERRMRKKRVLKDSDHLRSFIMDMTNKLGLSKDKYFKLRKWLIRQRGKLPEARTLALPSGTLDRIETDNRRMQDSIAHILFDGSALLLNAAFERIRRGVKNTPDKLISVNELRQFLDLINKRFKPSQWHHNDQLDLMQCAIFLARRCREKRSSSEPPAKGRGKKKGPKETVDIISEVEKATQQAIPKLVNAGLIDLELRLETWDRSFEHTANITQRLENRRKVQIGWEKKARAAKEKAQAIMEK